MAALASVADVETLRPLKDAERMTASVLIGRASALIRRRLRSVEADMAADPDYAEVVKGVVVDAVLRVIRNPDGKVQESIDDYTYRRADPVADGALYIADREWDLLVAVPTVTGSSGEWAGSMAYRGGP